MENLGWGLQMTVLGMGLVFALLTLLWGLLTLTLAFDKTPDAGTIIPDQATTSRLSPALVAAITVATLQHRQSVSRQTSPSNPAPDNPRLTSHWVAAGRARQNSPWHPKGK